MQNRVVRLGYQGGKHSNAHVAAKEIWAAQLSMRHRQDSASFVPLLSSDGVAQALCGGEADYGVMALRNNIGGSVRETAEAIAAYGEELEQVCSIAVPVHHCLFCLPGCSFRLKQIVSHEQALRQSAGNLRVKYEMATIITCTDQAQAAQDLSDGLLALDSGVLCRKEAGDAFGLELVEEDLEDRASWTLFVVFRVRESENNA